MKKRFYLTYSKELVKEPLIYLAGKEFNITTNIRQASISDILGLVALEIEGDEAEIEAAVNFFIDHGVKVEPIELDIIE